MALSFREKSYREEKVLRASGWLAVPITPLLFLWHAGWTIPDTWVTDLLMAAIAWPFVFVITFAVLNTARKFLDDA